jgi:hypothetical protein
VLTLHKQTVDDNTLGVIARRTTYLEMLGHCLLKPLDGLLLWFEERSGSGLCASWYKFSRH